MGKPSLLILLIGGIIVVLISSSSAATTYIVGDTAGWDISADLDTWPIDKNFTVGDILVFQYSQTHSVGEVTKESYDGCNVTKTIKTYTDGNTNITLTRPGDMYFLCGNKLHCLGGMKLQISVLPGQVAYAPAPAPSSGRLDQLPNPSTKRIDPAKPINNQPNSAAGMGHHINGWGVSLLLSAAMVASLLVS